ncbi:MAG TPA: TAXI family TRAP transporter solute-binding subunit [Solirubrobacteraceae bacterium]|nr:TAXI family TRAP transporter solute-binding subunit [Solirubrobacteraceae bacterium]
MSDGAAPGQLPAGPRLAHPVTVRFAGDWGGANLHRVCGWLAMELWDRAGPGTRTWIRSARGCADNLAAVGSGEVDVAVMTPASFARMAVEGRGPFQDRPYPDLVALGQVPHRDALLFALDARLGIESMAQLRDQAPRLRIAASPAADGANPAGFAAHWLLARSGARIVDWGGELLLSERPLDCIRAVAEQRADGLVHEAIMTTWWHELASQRALAFLPFEDEVLDAAAEQMSWALTTVPAGYLDGIHEPLRTVDFSGYLVVVRREMSDELAYLLAWALGETAARFEAQFHHIPAPRSPVSYPIERAQLAATPIPLHPAAERYFRKALRP